ncbi:hypothetical protein EV128_12143 [Rhizobium azibense]|nr:hypothetical protein EV128_12143 [Rhizobium azibense]
MRPDVCWSFLSWMNDLNQTSLTISTSHAMAGAAWMVLAGVVFSILNVVTQWAAMKLAFPSASIAFWQYAFALVFSLPFLYRAGFSAMRTNYPGAMSCASPVRRLASKPGSRGSPPCQSGRRPRW